MTTSREQPTGNNFVEMLTPAAGWDMTQAWTSPTIATINIRDLAFQALFPLTAKGTFEFWGSLFPDVLGFTKLTVPDSWSGGNPAGTKTSAIFEALPNAIPYWQVRYIPDGSLPGTGLLKMGVCGKDSRA